MLEAALTFVALTACAPAGAASDTPPPPPPPIDRLETLDLSDEHPCFGGALAPAGDVNGDGHDDLLVGSFDDSDCDNGGVHVLLGGTAGLSEDSMTTILRGSWLGQVTREVIDGAGDLDGDGYDDVLVAAWGEQVLIFRGGPEGLEEDAWLSLEQPEDSFFGYTAAGVGDMNGDGWPDIAACAADLDDTLYLYPGSAGGPSMAWEVVANARCGGELRGLGDVDGDGYGDLWAGTSSWDHLLLGSAQLDNESTRLQPQTHIHSYGDPVLGHAGDIDGDGWLDLVSSRMHDDWVTVYRGSKEGFVSDNAWHLTDDRLDCWFGQAVDMGGDMDGDGLSELIIGGGYASTGGAYLYTGHADGPGAGTTLLIDFFGTNDLGSAVSFAGDLDGDGYDDLAIGVPNQGRVYLLYGGGDEDRDGSIFPGDCDDDEPGVHPGATEICNDLDDDCDGVTDGEDAEGATTWYADSDGDGYASPNVSVESCDPPAGYTAGAEPWDCDDFDSSIHPGAEEIEGDQIDQDCDGGDPGGPVAGDSGDGEPDPDGCGCASTSIMGRGLLLAGIALAVARRRRTRGGLILLASGLLGCPSPLAEDTAVEELTGRPFDTLLEIGDGTTWFGGHSYRCGAWSAEDGYQEIPRPGDWHRGTGIEHFVEHDDALWVWFDDQLMRWVDEGWEDATPLLGETTSWGYEGQLTGLAPLDDDLWSISQLGPDSDPDCYWGCDETHELFLHRWDGAAWVRVEHLQIEGSSHRIASTDETLLLSQNEVLWAWDGGALTPITHPLEEKLRQVVGTGEGTIFIRDGEGGIAVGDREGLQRLTAPDEAAIDFISAHSREELYALAAGVLFQHDGTGWTEIPTDTTSAEAISLAPAGTIHLLAHEGSNSLHIGDDGGVYEVWREED